MPEPRAVTIAGGQGFYGDTPTAVDALLAEGVDYLCLEALAELTLAILQKDRQRDETRGYTRDLPAYLARALPFVADGRTKVDHERGRHQPDGRGARRDRDRARSWASPASRSRPCVGDDVLTRLDALHAEHGQAFAHLDTGAPFDDVPGAAAVRVRVPRRAPDRRRARAGRRHRDHRSRRRRVAVPRAARARARLGVGRLGPPRGRHPRRPPARVLGPEPRRQLLGRLVGAARTRGTCRTRSRRVDADGTAVITKPAASGGRVSTDTLRHQLLYEVHDPARYLAPDVVADFTSARFEDLPDDRVRITGVRGTPATDTYKLLLAYHAGWVGRGARRVLVARRVREGEGHGRDPREAGRDGRARRSTSGASSTGASTRSAGRPCRRRRPRASRPSACCASRGGAPTSAPRGSSAASSCRSRCRRRPRA